MNAFWQAGDVITDFKGKIDAYARQFIYADDRTRFRQFLDPEAICRQAEQSGRSEAIEMFRVQKPNGRFVWMIFDAIVIYKSATKDILICVRENIWERQENLYTLLPQFLADLNPDRIPRLPQTKRPQSGAPSGISRPIPYTGKTVRCATAASPLLS